MKNILAFSLAIFSIVGLAIVALLMMLLALPSVFQLDECLTTKMNNVSLCPKSAQYVTYNQVSPFLISAIVASEDAAFFSHNGFDWFEIRQSIDANLKEKGYKRGGSTITQQLAKNVFLTREKSLVRKLREAFLTYQIERHYKKNQILEKYLNVVEFGPGIYGIKSAAHYYFNKTPANLNVLESSFLAFLLPNPAGYHKSFQQKQLTPFAKKIISQLLFRLQSFKKITPQAYQAAISHLDDFPWANLSNFDFNQAVETPKADESDSDFDADPAPEETPSDAATLETPEEEITPENPSVDSQAPSHLPPPHEYENAKPDESEQKGEEGSSLWQ